MKDRIIALYQRFVREHSARPSSLMELLQDQEDIAVADFEANFYGFEDLENAIWLAFFEETQSRLRRESVYEEYSVREKLLAFYYTLIEVLKENRSYVVALPHRKGLRGILDRPFAIIREPALHYFEELMQLGSTTQEVQERRIVSRQYANLLWLETEYILQFWLRDKSPDFEQTDAAIEKAANLGMDLLGKNIVDSTFDFIKFAFQRK